MFSPSAIHEQRQQMLVSKIAYLREEKKLAELSIMDITLRTKVVHDIVSTIRDIGMELGGHVNGAWHPIASFERSSEASATNTGNEGGC